MAIVKQYMDGNCKVIFCDDYLFKTKEEIEAALTEIAEIYADARAKLYYKEQGKFNKQKNNR